MESLRNRQQRNLIDLEQLVCDKEQKPGKGLKGNGYSTEETLQTRDNPEKSHNTKTQGREGALILQGA